MLARSDSNVSEHDKLDGTDLASVPNDNASTSSASEVAENDKPMSNLSDASADVQLKSIIDPLNSVRSQSGHTGVYLSPILVGPQRTNTEEEEKGSSFDTLGDSTIR
jgi:hypothetical protein